MTPHAIHGVAVDEQEGGLNQAAADGADRYVVAGPAQAARQHAQPQRQPAGPEQAPGADGGADDGEPLHRTGDPGDAQYPHQHEGRRASPRGCGCARGDGATTAEGGAESRRAGTHQQEVDRDGPW